MRCKYYDDYLNTEIYAECLCIKDGSATVIPDGYACSNTIPVEWIIDLTSTNDDDEHICKNCGQNIKECDSCEDFHKEMHKENDI